MLKLVRKWPTVISSTVHDNSYIMCYTVTATRKAFEMINTHIMEMYVSPYEYIEIYGK